MHCETRLKWLSEMSADRRYRIATMILQLGLTFETARVLWLIGTPLASPYSAIFAAGSVGLVIVFSHTLPKQSVVLLWLYLGMATYLVITSEMRQILYYDLIVGAVCGVVVLKAPACIRITAVTLVTGIVFISMTQPIVVELRLSAALLARLFICQVVIVLLSAPLWYCCLEAPMVAASKKQHGDTALPGNG